MTPAAFNAYVTWAIYAIGGQTPEADAVMRAHRADVLAGAASQREMFPTPLVPTPLGVHSGVLYRGVLLEPEDVTPHPVQGDTLKPDVHLESVSFTEDLDVAHYFADPESHMSALVKQMRPKAEGYVIEYQVHEDDVVLFHHAWRRTGFRMPEEMRVMLQKKAGRELNAKAMPIGPLAVMQLGQQRALQLMWTLRTQREVVLLRGTQPLPVRRRDAYPAPPPTRVLNDRYTPPFLEME